MKRRSKYWKVRMLIVLDIISFKTEHRRIIAYKSAMTSRGSASAHMMAIVLCFASNDISLIHPSNAGVLMQSAYAWKLLLRQPLIMVSPESIFYRLPPSCTYPVLYAERDFIIFHFKMRVFSRYRKTAYIRDGCGTSYT